MLMSFPGKDQYSWSYPWSVEAWIGADEMSFSDELINVVPYRPVLVRAHATRHPIPWCPAQHQLAAISNQDQERGGEATGSSLQASGTPAGRAPAAATQRQPPHPWGPRGEDQPWVDTAG